MTLPQAFAAARYGPSTQRCQLTATRRQGDSPSWAKPGQSWAIITAWNPHGLRRSSALNRAAQIKLRAAIAAQGYCLVKAVNGDGEWQEDSFLVTHVSFSKALHWGRQFGQAAVLCGVGQRAALLWVSGDAPQRYWVTLTV